MYVCPTLDPSREYPSTCERGEENSDRLCRVSCQHSREAEEMPEPRAGMLPASRLRQEAPGERRTGCEAGTREQRFACSRGTPLGGYRRTSE